jgi:aspartyl aminopeptidase
VAWQAKELGKVDEGGGGTIAKFLAKYGLDMVDCGPPVLGMHSPFEIASKADLYETFKAYRVFLEKS